MSSTVYPQGSAFPWAEHERDRCNDGLKVKYHHDQLGHRYWGFVIYRCTYGDDAAWSEFIRILNERARKSVTFYGTEDLMESLNWNVQEDRALLDGASKDFVRQRFKDWVANCPADEKSRPDAAPFTPHQTPRTTYCVQVDEAALRSAVELAPKPPDSDRDHIGYVNLVCATWTLPDPAEHDPEETGTDDPFDEGEDPVEGSKLYDVGWMKVGLQGLVLPTYARLLRGDWELSYVRPPEVAVH